MKQLLQRLYISPNTPLVSYEQLHDQNAFEEIIVEDDIMFERIPLFNDNSVLYRCIMPPGSKFLFHYHDCKEVVNIKSGLVLHKGVKYPAGKQVIVQAYVQHAFEALEETLLYVEFMSPTF